MTDASIVRSTAYVCAEFLGAVSHRDWSAPIPDLELSVAAVVAHAAEGCLWYAIDLSAGGNDLTQVEQRVNVDGTNGSLVDTLVAFANVIASVVDSSPASARGFHPLGTADPSGFAAMACDEMLIHTDDVARCFDVGFEPPPELAARVLTRLFPWISPSDDVWEQLRWANGRVGLPDAPRLSEWVWHCAPLAEWDGRRR